MTTGSCGVEIYDTKLRNHCVKSTLARATEVSNWHNPHFVISQNDESGVEQHSLAQQPSARLPFAQFHKLISLKVDIKKMEVHLAVKHNKN